MCLSVCKWIAGSPAERVQQDKIPYDKWYELGLIRLCIGNAIKYSDVTAWLYEVVQKYESFPAWGYYDSYFARYFVEEMQIQGFNIVRAYRGKNAFLAYADVRGILTSHLRQYPCLEMVFDECTRTDRPQRQYRSYQESKPKAANRRHSSPARLLCGTI